MQRNLLFVVNVDWFFWSHRLPIALEAQRQGFRVHIATRLTGLQEQIESLGIVVHPLAAMNRSSTGLADACRTVVELWRLYKSVLPDVVHLVTIKPVLLGGLVARFAGVPAVVMAVSGLGFVFTATGFKALLRRLAVTALYRLAFGHRNLKIIFQNADDQLVLTKSMGLPQEKINLIRGSGVDLTVFCKVPQLPAVPEIVFAARLLIDKGVCEFVDAARLLKARGVSARFCIVGTVDPDNPSSVDDFTVKQWENEGVVELWGHRSDMPNVLKSAYLVVLPSYREGLPKILLEAAACGRAVVTTDVPGCRDAITPGITGILVPARNVIALSDALEALINDPVRCRDMGDAGRLLAERSFDVQLVVDKHLDIYEELIETS